MRPTYLLSCAVLLTLTTGCMQTRSLTEQYIKTQIEEHTPGTTSSLRTYTIYKSPVSATSTTYLELTGYKYNDTKGLVIGADRFYKYHAKLTGLPMEGMEVNYIVLNETQCKALLDREPVIKTALKISNRPIAGEEVYQDYTVKEDLFISYRRTPGQSRPMYLDLWVYGCKYPIPPKLFLQKLRKFMTY